MVDTNVLGMEKLNFQLDINMTTHENITNKHLFLELCRLYDFRSRSEEMYAITRSWGYKTFVSKHDDEIIMQVFRRDWYYEYVIINNRTDVELSIHFQNRK